MITNVTLLSLFRRTMWKTHSVSQTQSLGNFISDATAFSFVGQCVHLSSLLQYRNHLSSDIALWQSHIRKFTFTDNLITHILMEIIRQQNGSRTSAFANEVMNLSRGRQHYWILYWNMCFREQCEGPKHVRYLAMGIDEPTQKHPLRHRFCCVHVLMARSRNWSTLLLITYLLRACL